MFRVSWVGGDNGGAGWPTGGCHSKAFVGAGAYCVCCGNIAGSLLPSVTYIPLKGAGKL